MSEADYQKHVDARILSLLEKDKTLAAETGRFWSHIEGQGREYEFDQEQTDATYLKTLPKSELLAFYDEFIMPGSNSPKRRKFSVQMKSKLAKVDESVKLPENNKMVEDPIDFKTGLRISRGSVPVKKMEEFMK
jgi:secreted Zn-dependent insulinase-like peptidase